MSFVFYRGCEQRSYEFCVFDCAVTGISSTNTTTITRTYQVDDVQPMVLFGTLTYRVIIMLSRYAL